MLKLCLLDNRSGWASSKPEFQTLFDNGELKLLIWALNILWYALEAKATIVRVYIFTLFICIPLSVSVDTNECHTKYGEGAESLKDDRGLVQVSPGCLFTYFIYGKIKNANIKSSSLVPTHAQHSSLRTFLCSHCQPPPVKCLHFLWQQLQSPDHIPTTL